jgi:hypothetical protein
MRNRSDWKELAVCANDPDPSSWLSYDYQDVLYAKEGCSRCKVKSECFTVAWSNPLYVGVNAGISEYDYLILTWKEAKKANESNWSRTNKSFQTILRQIS